ncbi:MAG: hypothetical protein ACXIUV_14770 [Alkalilacustris sp.]
MTPYRRIVMLLAVAALSATAGAALWDRHRPIPAETLVMLSACGLVPAPDPVALPLASLFADRGFPSGSEPGPGLIPVLSPNLVPNLAPSLSLGPILHPGLDAPLWVRFKALDIADSVDGDPLQSPRLRPHMEDGVLMVPVARGQVPDAIRLGCRHGHVAEVRHRHAGTWHSLPVTPEPQASSARPPPGTARAAARDAGGGYRHGAGALGDGPADQAAPGPEAHAATLATD